MLEFIKKSKVVIMSIILLLIMFIGATYAYFSSQIGGAGTANVTLTTKTTDSLTFQTGANITLGPVTTSNFTNGGSNVSGSTTATATLRANNNTNQASETYNVYLRINENTFHKTGSNAELLLTITDPSNNAVTSLSGLTYTTVGTVSGFDVTESTGLITIASNRAISVTGTSNNPKVDTWNITLTFVNLGSDQTDNAGASFSAEAIIQNDALSTDKYWNAGFNKYYYSYPLGQYKTSSSGSWQNGNPSPMYDSLVELQTNYSSFSSRPYYIKTTSTEHQACLYYNNHEFCLGTNYWVSGDSDGTQTELKIKNAMETAFETNADSCNHDVSFVGYSARCFFGSFECATWPNGNVWCASSGPYCQVNSDGTAICWSNA